MNRRVNVRAIIIDENDNIFAVKHRTHDNKESEYWATIGGGLNSGESLHDGLTRECVEEVGISPDIGRLLFVQQFIYTHHDDSKTEKLEFFFHVTNYNDFKTTIDLSGTSHGHELLRAGFIDPKQSDLLPEFLKDVHLNTQVLHDVPVQFFDNLREVSRS
jgi:8-oxo-dGTP diphosphatase